MVSYGTLKRAGHLLRGRIPVIARIDGGPWDRDGPQYLAGPDRAGMVRALRAIIHEGADVDAAAALIGR